MQVKHLVAEVVALTVCSETVKYVQIWILRRRG
jgi:hypothetical protein